jgi:hypothetical protein
MFMQMPEAPGIAVKGRQGMVTQTGHGDEFCCSWYVSPKCLPDVKLNPSGRRAKLIPETRSTGSDVKGQMSLAGSVPGRCYRGVVR